MNAVKRLLSIKTLKYIIIAIDAVVPLIVIPYGTDYFYYPKILVIYILLGLALLITGTSIISGTIGLKISKKMLPLIFFILLVMLSAAFSQYKYQAFWGRPARNEGMLTYVSYFLIFYISWLSFENDDDFKALISFMVPSACLISLYGILQYAGIDPIPRDNIRESWKSISFSTLGNPNFLGSYLSLMFPVTLSLYVSGRFKKQGALLFIANIILFTALICTNTRSAWIGTLFSVILILIQAFKRGLIKPSKVAPIVCTLFLSAVIFNIISGGLLSSRLKSIGEDYKVLVNRDKNLPIEQSMAGSERIFIWARSMNYIFDRPILGSGPDTFDKVFHMSNEEAEYHFGSKNIYVDKAHNEYLQILITLGFPALISYFWFLYILFKNTLFKEIDNNNIMLISLIFPGIFAYLIQAFFNISVVSVAPVYWSLLGIACPKD